MRKDVGVRLPQGRVRCPDVALVRTQAASDLTKSRFDPDDVVLAVEIESPDSRKIDRDEKPFEYAAVGIQFYWRVEREGNEPVVHTYELDLGSRAYRLVGVYRDRLKVTEPFDIEIDLTDVHRF